MARSLKGEDDLWLVLVALIAVLFLASKAQAEMNNSPKIERIAQAIAKAEGYGASGAIPTRANNPGDLKLGDLGHGAISGKTIFASIQDGWNALRKQIHLMASGGSDYYQPTDTWRRIAQVWVGTNDYPNWMNTVTGELGVDPDSTLEDYLAS